MYTIGQVSEVQVLYDLSHGRTPGKTELNVSAG